MNDNTQSNLDASFSQDGASPRYYEGREVKPGILFVFAIVFVASASGGLIYGYGPFVDRLVDENVVASSDTQIIFDNAFQIMTGFTLVWTFHLDHWGPRVIAASGALVGSLGNCIVAATLGMQPVEHAVYWLLCGYGLIGGGGIAILLASFNIAQLFPDKGFRVSIITACFNASGCVYILLSIKSIPLVVFFAVSAAYTCILAVLLMIFYPSTAYDGSSSTAHVCGPCVRSRCIVFPLSTLRVTTAALKTLRYWAFFMAFSWETVILTWMRGALLDRYPHVSSFYADIGYPFLTNASCFVTPLLGMAIDKCGFTGIICLNILVFQIGLILFYFDTSIVQWLVLFCILLMSSCTFTVQFAYLSLAFPSNMFPGLMFLTVVGQFFIGLIAVFLASKPWGANWTLYLVFLFVPTLLMYAFPILQRREEKKNGSER